MDLLVILISSLFLVLQGLQDSRPGCAVAFSTAFSTSVAANARSLDGPSVVPHKLVWEYVRLFESFGKPKLACLFPLLLVIARSIMLPPSVPARTTPSLSDDLVQRCRGVDCASAG